MCGCLLATCFILLAGGLRVRRPGHYPARQVWLYPTRHFSYSFGDILLHTICADQSHWRVVCHHVHYVHDVRLRAGAVLRARTGHVLLAATVYFA